MNLFEKWKTRQTGLWDNEVIDRRKKFGSNFIEKDEEKNIIEYFIEEVKKPLNLILLIAAFGSFFLALKDGEGYIDFYVIIFAILINIFISIFQARKTNDTFEKLNESKILEVLVTRNGEKEIILSRDLVVGDIVLLHSGDKVPADLVLFSSNNLKVDESSFTGESMSVAKNHENKKINTEDANNVLYSGTIIMSGQAEAIVTAVGINTEFGKILKTLQEVEKRESPMELKMKKITFLISAIAVIATVVIVFAGLISGKTVTEIILLGIAVAVSAIPEGIGASISAALSVGAYRILKKGGLVKDLVSAETLASVNTVLTDKTGTLTSGIMTYDGSFSEGLSEKDIKIFATLASSVFWDNKNKRFSGDEMDVAIAKSLKKDNIDFNAIQSENIVLDELPFNSKNKFYISLREDFDGISKNKTIYIKGAPEKILEKCNKIQTKSGVIDFNIMTKYKFFEFFKRKQSVNSRFLALAYRKTHLDFISKDTENVLDDLVFVSLIYFNDPLKKNIKDTISEIKSMGTDVIMVTGDSKEIAYEISEKTGLINKEEYASLKEKVIEGTQMKKMSEDEIYEASKKTKIFARVDPEDKLKLANAMIKGGRTIAMTGDGVNDVLALSKADIGISFKNASAAAQETASLVLINNDFKIITEAVKEGRNIIENIRKTVIYLLSSSFTEIIVIAGALIIGGPLPFLTGQILWANIIEEGLMNFSFIFGKNEEAEKSNGKFNSKILTKEVKTIIFTLGIFDATTTLILYYYLNTLGLEDIKLQSLMFLALVMDFLFVTIALQNLRKPVWRINIFSNLYLVIALFIGVISLSLAIFTEKGREILHLEKFSQTELLYLLGFAVFDLILLEFLKYIIFWGGKKDIIKNEIKNEFSKEENQENIENEKLVFKSRKKENKTKKAWKSKRRIIKLEEDES